MFSFIIQIFFFLTKNSILLFYFLVHTNYSLRNYLSKFFGFSWIKWMNFGMTIWIFIRQLIWIQIGLVLFFIYYFLCKLLFIKVFFIMFSNILIGIFLRPLSINYLRLMIKIIIMLSIQIVSNISKRILLLYERRRLFLWRFNHMHTFIDLLLDFNDFVNVIFRYFTFMWTKRAQIFYKLSGCHLKLLTLNLFQLILLHSR